MFLFYNIITLLLMPLLLLWLLIHLFLNPEKRAVIPQRLGLGLVLPESRKENTIWIHALSVGEITSAALLVKQLYQNRGASTTIIFSTTTVSGHKLARQQIIPYCDALIYAPLDFLPVVRHFQRKIQPDLFVLIETDFWPNLLHTLADSGTRLLLFNGRISDNSMQRYQRFSFFFTRVFDTFTLLCMQTDNDVKKMVRLGIAREKSTTLGNLKFGNEPAAERVNNSTERIFAREGTYIFAGSTHAGEEELILDAFVALRTASAEHPRLVLAPRNISRCDEVVALTEKRDLPFTRFSSATDGSDVIIVDTIGDLPALYRYADLSFIGGSLVDQGGHNPLEAARFGKPVLFGPYMDDFSEISRQLQECGAARLVNDGPELSQCLAELSNDATVRKEMGRRARAYTAGHEHVVGDHLKLIDSYL